MKEHTEQMIQEWQEMIEHGTTPLFEIELINDEYLLVYLECDKKGIRFYFDNDNKPVYFDGIIQEITQKGYRLPFDDCFSLDEHLETVYSNVNEGFIIPNQLFV